MSASTSSNLEIPGRREWAKHLALWLSITALLPLTTWYTTAAIHPPPDEAEYRRAMDRYGNSDQWPKDPKEKDKFFAEKERLQKEYEAAEKVFYRRMFWVTYPVGLLAIIAGLYISVHSIGAGFMFGGIFALTSGCYSAWDVVRRWTRFGSLVLALVVIVLLGFRHVRANALRSGVALEIH